MPPNLIGGLVEEVEEALSSTFAVVAVLDAGASMCHLLVSEPGDAGRRHLLHAFSRRALRERGLDASVGRSLAEWKALDHPHVVPLAHLGETATLRWCAFEAPSRSTLADSIRAGGALAPAAAIAIVESVASALLAAHQRGLAHGGLRPVHVHLDPAGRASVTGFGIATAIDALAGLPPVAWNAAADQAALARLFRSCVSGRPVEAGDDLERLGPSITPTVRAVLLRAERVEEDARFGDVTAFARALGAAVRLARRNAPVEPQELLLVEPVPRMSRAWRLAILTTFLLVAAMPAKRLWQASEPSLGALLAPLAPASRDAAKPPPLGLVSHGDVEFESPGPELAPIATPVAPGRPAPAKPAPREPSRQQRTTPPPERRAPARTPSAPAEPLPEVVDLGPSLARIEPEPAQLGVSAIPWGHLYVDGKYIGETPVLAIPIVAGAHVLRVVRPGFRPVERTIVVEPGQRARVTDIRLEREIP